MTWIDETKTLNHPQTSFDSTTFEKNSFFGHLRSLYAETVLQTQLDQLKKQGSYEAFDLKWRDVYNVRRLEGGKTRQDGIPPSLFWESDVGKWIEAVCYFLSSEDTKNTPQAATYKQAMDHIIDLIVKAQQDDGYLNIYFTVVDPEGKFRNLRDMHEMYNAGHLLEASLAHYRYSGSREFLDVMIKYVDCFINHFGPNKDQKHGYPGHPELELAILRLYALTGEKKHLDFGTYLLEARGVKREDQGGMSYFEYEGRERGLEPLPTTMDLKCPETYNQSHASLHEQDTILGHSVRAFYLITAAADLGGKFYDDAHRLWTDAVDRKMYVTGGFGSEPRWEGFSEFPYHLPVSIKEGGCYAETCASIAAMMTSERLLYRNLSGKVRDTMELCLYNAVLGGGDLQGKAFSYENRLATWGDESAKRADWFEVCCCPPNLSRTLGMLGGYTWRADVDSSAKKISVIVYLYMSCTRVIDLPNGRATIKMQSGMPWKGETSWEMDAPEGWTWEITVPKPNYASNFQIKPAGQAGPEGFLTFSAGHSSRASSTMDLPVRVLASHPLTGQDTLTVSRGPIVYIAEDFDNDKIEASYSHFEGVGLAEDAKFETRELDIQGQSMVAIAATSGVRALVDESDELYREVNGSTPARKWKSVDSELVYVPWFARANRGGRGHVRVWCP